MAGRLKGRVPESGRENIQKAWNIRGNQTDDGGKRRGIRAKMRLCGIEEGLARLAESTWFSFEPEEAAGVDGMKPPGFLKICRNRCDLL